MELPQRISRPNLTTADDVVVDELLASGFCPLELLRRFDPPTSPIADGAPLMVTREQGWLYEPGFYDPGADLPTYLDTSFFAIAEYEPAPRARLLDAQPLREVLRADFHAGRRGRKFRQVSDDLGDDYDETDRLDFALLPSAREELLRTQALLGPSGVCDCGLVDCANEYVWIEGGVCLLSARMSAGHLRDLSFFPFDVLASWQDPRWLHDHACVRDVPQLVGDFDELLMCWVAPEVIDRLTRDGQATAGREALQLDYAETSLILDESLREASLQDLLRRGFLGTVDEFCDDEQQPWAKLRLTSPLCVAQLLRMALARNERREMARMHYAPDLDALQLSQPETWSEDGVVLGELYRQAGKIRAIKFFPSPHDNGARGSFLRSFREGRL